MLIAVVLLAGCGRPGGGRPGGAQEDARSGATGEEAMWAREDRTDRAIEAVEISAGRFIDYVQSSGRIAGSREATVVSESQGVLQRVEFDLGMSVTQGDLLAAFDERVERLALEQARAAAESARVELDAVQRSVDAGAASRNDLARVEAAAAGADAEYQRATKRLEDRRITAPIGGRVARKDSRVSEGNYLPAGVNVAHIVDTARLQIQLAVGEREIGYVSPGARAEITMETCEPQVGSVSSVAAGSDPQTGSFAVIVTWDNRCGDRVRSGMSAEVRIEPNVEHEALIVPTAALLRRQGETVVFVIENDTASRRQVVVGRRVGNRAEVVDGLVEGELVAVSALSTLADGQPVEATLKGRSGELR
ncbi:MAG: efflux RND transporter periplasmic adaptor subunit [Spirochaetaceae bacterium]|nr:MAG: efflux RND transporter periplasmic adaptor subunit [Spirochaetaceae bacterium]